MDVLFSIVTGLGLRLFLDILNEPLGLLNPVLLGICEGAAVHHFSVSTSYYSSSDHYLAYALRIALDLYFTANPQRTLIVVLWTTLGFLVSETLSPSLSLTRHSHSRRRSSRSSVAHIRQYQPAVTPEPLPINPRHTPQVAAQNVTPTFRPSRPPSPPSFFLEDNSDATISPREPRYLPSALGPASETDSLSDSSSPKPVLLPTPPSTLTSGALDVQGSGLDERRLSTIEEQSSCEERSQPDIRFLDIPGGHIGFMQPSYAPSAATTAPPLPVPNSTIHGHRTSVARASPVAQLEEAENTYAASMSAAPLPIPNVGTTYVHAKYTSTPSTPSDSDPLQTPQTARRLELTDNDDGLTTPPALTKELSPLVLEQTLFPSFGQVVGEVPAAQPIPEVLVEMADTNTNTATATTTTTVVTADVQLPVEYPSQPVIPDAQGQDNPNSNPAVFKSESGPGLDNKNLKPPTKDQQRQRQQKQQQQQLHDEGQETETEISAASIISSGPGQALYAKANALRDQARAAETEKLRLMNLLNQAVRKGRVKDVLSLKEEIRLEEEKAMKLHKRAARRFYRARNAAHNPRSVDVHGLRVSEAIQITEKSLRDAFTLKCPSIRIIVGKGLHSVNGTPVLKTEITKAMQKLHIPCAVDPHNAGVLIFTLPTS